MPLVHGRDLPKDLYRMLNPDMKHYGFQWRVGVNVDPLPWNPKGSCLSGGLYFTTYDQLQFHASYPVDENWIGRITVDDDEPVWQDGDKWKAHKVTLSDVVAVHDLDDLEYFRFISSTFSSFYNKTSRYADGDLKKEWRQLMHYHPVTMQFARHDDWDVCFDLVGLTKRPEEYDLSRKADKDALLRAASKNGHILKFLPRIDEDIAMRAVKDCGSALRWVPAELQTHKMCMQSMHVSTSAFKYIADPTPAICSWAVKQDVSTIQHMKVKTTYLVHQAILQDATVLQYLTADEQTDEVVLLAMGVNKWAFQYVKRKTPAVCELAVEREPRNLQFVPDDMQTEHLCSMAVQTNLDALQHVAPKFRYLFVEES